MFTPMDFDDEPLGLTLARCYRLARERARSTHDLREQNKVKNADITIAPEGDFSDGCASAQPVIQSS
jgi:hypothetical protein